MKKIYVVIFEHGVSNPKVVYSEDHYPKLDQDEIGNFSFRIIIIQHDTHFECYSPKESVRRQLNLNQILLYLIQAESRDPGFLTYEDIQKVEWLQELRFKVDI